MRTKLGCALLVMSCGCGIFNSQPVTAADQWGALRDDLLGHLDENLQPTGDRGATANSPADTHKHVDWVGYDGEKICVELRIREPLATWEDYDKILASYTKAAEALQLAFTTQDSLTAGMTEFPPKPADTTMRLVDEHVGHEDDIDSGGDPRRTYNYKITFEWCAPAPAIKPETKFITATFYGKETPQMYVWELSGPYAGGSNAPPDTAPSPDEATAPTD